MEPSDSPLDDALGDLESLEQSGLAVFAGAASTADVEAARIEYLGQKQGKIRAAQERIKELPGTAKKSYGQRFNATKRALEEAFDGAKARLERPGVAVGGLDVTRPGSPRPRLGHLHPLTQTTNELIDLFGRFGFSVARGPEVEDIFHNFEALNIPAAHPARDPLDNFYLPGGLMLRSQTSTVQIRVMERQEPPVRIVAIGRVYRPDTVDATHSFMFHQVEGLMVDHGVTMADLKTVLRLFAESYLGEDVQSASGRRSSRSPSRAWRWTCSGTAATAGSRWGGPGWWTPTCCVPSVMIPTRSPASPSGSGSNDSACGVTASMISACSTRTTPASSGSSDGRRFRARFASCLFPALDRGRGIAEQGPSQVRYDTDPGRARFPPNCPSHPDGSAGASPSRSPTLK